MVRQNPLGVFVNVVLGVVVWIHRNAQQLLNAGIQDPFQHGKPNPASTPMAACGGHARNPDLRTAITTPYRVVEAGCRSMGLWNR